MDGIDHMPTTGQGIVSAHDTGMRVDSRDFESLDKLLQIQFTNTGIKRRPAYGLKLVKSLWQYITVGNEYYGTRYEKWRENDLWAKGSWDNKEFMPVMGVEGNQAFINIDWTILKIVPRYIKSIVDRFMGREAKATVKATDILSMRFKEREKVIAKYQFKNREKINRMQQASGMELESGMGMQAEDEDALDMYYKMEWRMPEESFMEDTVEEVWKRSDNEDLTRQWLNDLVKKNIAVGKIEELPGDGTPASRMRVEWCDPDNTVHNIFKRPNGKDVTLIGRAYAYSIADARRKYPGVTEEQWFRVAQVSKQGLNQSKPLEWMETYVYSLTRPYDDYRFIAFDFEVKVFDSEWYVTGGFGVAQKKGMPVGLKEGNTMEQVDRINWYGGLWVVNTDVMLKWEVNSNQIRPFQNGVDSFSNYCIVYPDADGFYVPSLEERGIPCVRQMVLIGLKIQQMVALMEPDGLTVDIAGLQDLDIGTGKKLKPIQLMAVKRQTGVTYYDSRDTSGVGGEGNPSPFTNTPYAGNVAQLNILTVVFNFWLQRLNDEWGENAETMGAATPGKKSAAAVKQAAAVGGAASEYIYDYLIEIKEQFSRKIVYKLWDMLVFEGADYKQMAGVERDMISATFDVSVDMVDKRARKERLMARIQEALDSKIITMSTAERLEDIDNPKTAILYLEKVEKRARKQAMEAQRMQMQMNAQVQQQSTQIATQGKIAEIQAQAQAKAVIEMVKGNEAEYKELVKLVADVEKKAQETGAQVPMELKALKAMLVSEVVGKHQQAGQGQQGQQPEGGGQPVSG